MAVLVDEEDVPRRPDGKALVSGLFACGTKEKTDRLIVNRRPCNWEEESLGWAKRTPPHGSQLARLVLNCDETVLGSGDDLHNYFYTLAQYPPLIRRSVLGHAFDPAPYPAHGGKRVRICYLGLRVIPTGDRNAVDIAQQCHVDALAKQLGERSLLSYQDRLPSDELLEGIYIDDKLLVKKVKKSEFLCPGEETRLCDESHRAYKKKGMPRSEQKSFGCSRQVREGGLRTGDEQFVAWGTKVDGESGRV